VKDVDSESTIDGLFRREPEQVFLRKI